MSVNSSHGLIVEDVLSYMSGFGNEFATEAIESTLPKGQNNPQKCAHGLYAEQISGTAFTVPRANNLRTWLYRIRPSVCHEPFKLMKPSPASNMRSSWDDYRPEPQQTHWMPFEIPDDKSHVTWVEGLATLCGAGDVRTKSGMGVHIYTINTSMVNTAYCNSDGDFLIVPQQGRLTIRTEMGVLQVSPNEICVIPSGIRYAVEVDGPSRGYICEVFGRHFKLPDLGPIGANGLANARDFLTPVASYEDRQCDFTVVCKYHGEFFATKQDHSCFNVVGWAGNYVPFKYNLANFMVINATSYDHADPSIFTVLTCPSEAPGVAICDFVIFPPRWAVQDHTFRPPYYHRNIMSEFMGILGDAYEAKPSLVPGSSTLHSIMVPHGPDTQCYNEASTCELTPVRVAENSQSFMFESSLHLAITKWGAESVNVNKDYWQCWQGLKSNFTGPKSSVDPCQRK